MRCVSIGGAGLAADSLDEPAGPERRWRENPRMAGDARMNAPAMAAESVG